MRKIKQDEFDAQVLFFDWFKQSYPDVLMFMSLNGMKMNIGQAMKAKRSGMMKGVPDLEVPGWRLFIEMKKENGGVNKPHQKKIQQYLIANGYTVMVCRGYEDAVNDIEEFVKRYPEIIQGHVSTVENWYES